MANIYSQQAYRQATQQSQLGQFEGGLYSGLSGYYMTDSTATTAVSPWITQTISYTGASLTPEPDKPKAKKEADEFAWLRKRVNEIEWRA